MTNAIGFGYATAIRMRLIIPTAVLAFSLFLSGCVYIPKKTPVPPATTSTAQSEDWQVPEELAMYDISRITSTENIFPIEKPLDTSDWNVYRDEKCGFEMRYPKNKGNVWWKEDEFWNNVPANQLVGTDACQSLLLEFTVTSPDRLGIFKKSKEIPNGFLSISRDRKKDFFVSRNNNGSPYFGLDKNATQKRGVVYDSHKGILFKTKKVIDQNMFVFIENGIYIYSIQIYQPLILDENKLNIILHSFRFIDGAK